MSLMREIPLDKQDEEWEKRAADPYYLLIPHYIHKGLQNYVYRGWMPGGFTRHVLENNLMEAVCRADPDSLCALWQICIFVYNELPGNCHGSPGIVQEWIKLYEEDTEVSWHDAKGFEKKLLDRLGGGKGTDGTDGTGIVRY